LAGSPVETNAGPENQKKTRHEAAWNADWSTQREITSQNNTPAGGPSCLASFVHVHVIISLESPSGRHEILAGHCGRGKYQQSWSKSMC